jgi:hypothetical protein
MRARSWIAALTVLFSAGCRPANTFVLLDIERGDAVGDVDRIELDLALAGMSATTQLTDSGGGPITLPTTASLKILRGQGQLRITGIAYRADTEVSRGTVTGDVEPGTTDLTLQFGASIMAGDDLAMPPTTPPDLTESHTLTVTTSGVGGASGSVTGSSFPAQGDINCGQVCTAPYTSNTMVTLTAVPASGFYLSGWTGACTGVGPCEVQMNTDRTVGAVFSPANIVFVTSATYTVTQLAALGTGTSMTDQVLSGADKACANAATARSLPGHFVAWLAAAGKTVATRLQTANGTQQPRGWVRTDGKPALAYLGTRLLYPIDLDESGALIATAMPRAWAPTFADGITFPSNGDCKEWTSTLNTDSGAIGLPMSGDLRWSNDALVTCDQAASLYCFGADYVASVPPPKPPSPAKLAFLAGPFDPSTGLNGADSICMSAATSASLSGTFHALLATSTASAASRVTTNGTTPYVRPDGVVVAAKDTDLLSATPLMLAPIDCDVHGMTKNVEMFTGGSTPVALADKNCTDWTDKTAAVTSSVGEPLLGISFFKTSTAACSFAAWVYCLQN